MPPILVDFAQVDGYWEFPMSQQEKMTRVVQLFQAAIRQHFPDWLEVIEVIPSLGMIFCTTTSEYEFCSTFFLGGLFLLCFWLMTFDDFLNLCFSKHISYQVLEDEKHLSIEQWTSLNIIEQHWIYFLRVPWPVHNKTRVKAVEVSREAELETQDVQLEMKEAQGMGIYRSLPTKASR